MEMRVRLTMHESMERDGGNGRIHEGGLACPLQGTPMRGGGGAAAAARNSARAQLE